MGWFLFLLPFIEVYVFTQVGNIFGFFNAFMALVASFFLGLLVVQSQGRAFLMRAQGDLMRGQLPTRAVVHSLMVFLGGMLLMVPGFITDAIGLALILPGIRHVLAIWVRGYLGRQIDKGRLHIFNKTNWFNSNSSQNGTRTPWENTSERDVTPKIIDITAIKAERKKED